MTHAHLFDIDAPTWTREAYWWVLDKQQPDKYILRIPADEGDLVMSGFHKKQQLRIAYNGEEGWLNSTLYERIQKKRRMPLDRIGLSRREFLDADRCDDLARAAGIASALSAAGLDPRAGHEIVLLTAYTGHDHRVLSAELKRLLEPLDEALRINIRLQSCAASQRSAKGIMNAIMHAYEALELSVGLRINKDAFTPVGLDRSDLVRFYTDSTEQTEALFAANMLLRTVFNRSDEAIRQEIRQFLSASQRTLRVMQISTNRARPFTISDVDLYC